MRCDGLVVATPQGSTGYNLANGGPVMAWGVEGYVVSFIAPHSLTARALVVAPGDTLTINNRRRRSRSRSTSTGGRRRVPAGRGHPRRVRPHHGMLAQLPGAPSTTGCASSSAGWRARRFAPNSCRLCANLRRNICSPLFRRRPLVHPCVLHELRVENLLLIERAELRLGPGLERAHGGDRRGEDRARHALDLLLGGAAFRDRASGRGGGLRRGRVRASRHVARRSGNGSRRTPKSSSSPGASGPRVERGPRRRTHRDGGRPARPGAALLPFYGQHEHRKLAGLAQLEILDGFAGGEQRRARPDLPGAYTNGCGC